MQLLAARMPHLRVLLPTLPHLRAAAADGAASWGVPVTLADGDSPVHRCVASVRLLAAYVCAGAC